MKQSHCNTPLAAFICSTHLQQDGGEKCDQDGGQLLEVPLVVRWGAEDVRIPSLVAGQQHVGLMTLRKGQQKSFHMELHSSTLDGHMPCTFLTELFIQLM